MEGLQVFEQTASDLEWTEVTGSPSIKPLAGPFRMGASFVRKSDDGRVFIGQWASEPTSFDVVDHPFLEYCRVLEGTLRATDADGTVRLFEPGMTFIIPEGYCGRWDILSPFRKEAIAFARA
jgi:uncharacterized cupin superfamily protein